MGNAIGVNLTMTNTTPENDGPDLGATDRATAICLLIYNALIMVTGVLGNCLIVRVYWGKAHKCSTHVLIMGLAVADLTICLLRLWDVALNSSVLAGADLPDLTQTFNCFDYTAVGTSIMVTAVIALDRYDCVCRPTRRLMTHPRARKALLVAVAISVAVNIPMYVKVALVGTGVSACLDVLIYVSQVTSFVLPVIMISACYSIVFLAIRKHVKVRVAQARDGHVRDHRIDWSTRSQASLCVATVSGRVGLPARLGRSPGQGARRHSRRNRGIGHTPSQINREGAAEDNQPTDRRSTAPPGGPDFRGTRAPSPALQRRTTLMLFITSVVFILCWLPYWIKAFLEIFGGRSRFLDTFMEVLYLNNAINPFIYGLANRRFRKDCKNVIRKMRMCRCA